MFTDAIKSITTKVSSDHKNVEQELIAQELPCLDLLEAEHVGDFIAKCYEQNDKIKAYQLLSKMIMQCNQSANSIQQLDSMLAKIDADLAIDMMKEKTKNTFSRIEGLKFHVNKIIRGFLTVISFYLLFCVFSYASHKDANQDAKFFQPLPVASLLKLMDGK